MKYLIIFLFVALAYIPKKKDGPPKLAVEDFSSLSPQSLQENKERILYPTKTQRLKSVKRDTNLIRTIRSEISKD